MKHYMCLDIGGTAVKFGVAGESGVLLHKGEIPNVITQKGVDGLVESLASVTISAGIQSVWDCSFYCGRGRSGKRFDFICAEVFSGLSGHGVGRMPGKTLRSALYGGE